MLTLGVLTLGMLTLGMLDKRAVLTDLRLWNAVVLQMRSVVEPEEFGWGLPAFLNKNLDDVDRHRADFQSTIDRISQFFDLVVFQEPQNSNELATAIAIAV